MSAYLGCALCQNTLQTLSHVSLTVDTGGRHYYLVQRRKPGLCSLVLPYRDKVAELGFDSRSFLIQSFCSHS